MRVIYSKNEIISREALRNGSFPGLTESGLAQRQDHKVIPTPVTSGRKDKHQCDEG